MSEQIRPYLIHDRGTAPSTTQDTPVRSSNYELLASTLFGGLCSLIEEHERRIAQLEQQKPIVSAVASFANSRSSWTVNQLAEDLQVHPNTVLNWLALPADHPRHLDSFQPGGSGPHKILPEHVSDWMSRNGQKVA